MQEENAGQAWCCTSDQWGLVLVGDCSCQRLKPDCTPQPRSAALPTCLALPRTHAPAAPRYLLAAFRHPRVSECIGGSRTKQQTQWSEKSSTETKSASPWWTSGTPSDEVTQYSQRVQRRRIAGSWTEQPAARVLSGSRISSTAAAWCCVGVTLWLLRLRWTVYLGRCRGVVGRPVMDCGDLNYLGHGIVCLRWLLSSPLYG